MAENKKLRILCIHGYRQNAKTFREKTGALRKLTKKHADFDYITAPHRVPPGNMGSAAWAGLPAPDEKGSSCDTQTADPGERGWWFSREDEYFKSTDYSDVSVGFEQSVDMLRKVLEKGNVESCEQSDSFQGYDGVLAFSQGASLLSMLCLIQQKEQRKWFKFAILVAGFKSRSSKHSHHYQEKTSIPSLHVYGESDQIVSNEMSEELLQYFDNPKVWIHPGGHFVPATGPQKHMYVDFFKEMQKL
ncbi:hypothetical protein EGW08_012499 [Elysia chlorotica]|uniref:Serine hydrolase domain-containing protein n=1 Tax=Elysia chlorotica TaxID=188477 RepID=A0A3S1BAS3_ELYCH|nr:hypothetical protein EGW08_012499 [Elysia chlorotica]